MPAMAEMGARKVATEGTAGDMGFKTDSKRGLVAKVVAVSIALSGLGLCGCGENQDERILPPDEGETSSVGRTPAGGNPESAVTTEEDLTTTEVPRDGEAPTASSGDATDEAIREYLEYNFPDREVDGTEVIGRHDGDGESWETRLVRFKDGESIGLEVTRTGTAAPSIIMERYLRTSDDRYYDVETGQYVTNPGADRSIPSPDATQDAPYEPQALPDSPSGPATTKTESTPPDRVPVLVKNDDGQDVWVVLGDF